MMPPYEEVHLSIAGRSWSLLHDGVIITRDEEAAFVRASNAAKRPYGVALWPAAIPLAHELASRDVRGKRILELGAGTGLPGIVAASLGARVVQTDSQQLVLDVCKHNAIRNGVTSVEHRIADWTGWSDVEHYDLVIGSDILYTDFFYPFLKNIFETNLAAGGTVLVSDPMREQSIALFEAMEAEDWMVSLDTWTVGSAPSTRSVGVFALTR
jgi:methyltransferase-like protein 23